MSCGELCVKATHLGPSPSWQPVPNLFNARLLLTSHANSVPYSHGSFRARPSVQRAISLGPCPQGAHTLTHFGDGPQVVLCFQLSVWSSGSQSVLPGPAVSASSGRLSEMQILGSNPRPRNKEVRGQSPASCVLTSPPGEALLKD